MEYFRLSKHRNRGNIIAARKARLCEPQEQDTEQDTIYTYDIVDAESKVMFISWILDVEEGADVDFLKEHNNSFKILFDILEKLGTITVVVENHYVDRVYRDSYYFYYSSKHFNYLRFCKRISIFEGQLKKSFFDCLNSELQERFIGTVVLAPLSGQSVGRTLLNPNYYIHPDKGYVRLTKYDVTVFGKRLEVTAFPYGMQDGETTSCAEMTILNMLDYYSQSYSEYHYLLPSEINKIVTENSYERKLPTTGLSYELITKVFCNVGFYPRLYSQRNMTNNKFHHILNYYIESGIPVALGLKVLKERTKKTGRSIIGVGHIDSKNQKLGQEIRHSIIGIGHMNPKKQQLGRIINCIYDSENDHTLWISDTADLIDTYCVMDDNRCPYSIDQVVEKSEGELSKSNQQDDNEIDYEVEYMMVPLYKRMILEAADAYDICMSVISNTKFGITSFMENWGEKTKEKIFYNHEKKLGTKDEPLVIRLYMASSRTFRYKRDIQFGENNKELQDYYNQTVFPKFIWVCEISNKKMYERGKILGEIIIDATSAADAKVDSIIIVNYPNAICCRMPEDYLKANEAVFKEVIEWNPFDIFRGNLTEC